MTTRTDRRGQGFFEKGQSALTEKVVKIRRVAKVVKGGRHLTFSALVVVGDNQGRVGSGLGKAVAIPDAVRKGVTIAEKSLITVPMNGSTIPHQVEAKYGAAKVLVKPAPPGTGIKAGPSMRVVLDMVGAKDIVAKSLRSQNPINVVRATIEALSKLEKRPEQTKGDTVDLAPESHEPHVQEDPVVVEELNEEDEGAE
ncbi:MAG: small subunit ribosomal protein S5 [Chloroflexi bacterium]|jgi:small subunit ribosomal protein S5|nr:MAG: small subunit ribosomal protein S5 [Chloroflexota bacterium]